MFVEEYGAWAIMGPEYLNRVNRKHPDAKFMRLEELTPEIINRHIGKVGTDRWIIECQVNGEFTSWPDAPEKMQEIFDIAKKMWERKYSK